jgi:hypothetical protein
MDTGSGADPGAETDVKERPRGRGTRQAAGPPAKRRSTAAQEAASAASGESEAAAMSNTIERLPNELAVERRTSAKLREQFDAFRERIHDEAPDVFPRTEAFPLAVDSALPR